MRLRGVLAPLLGILLWGVHPGFARNTAWTADGSGGTSAEAAANDTQPATGANNAPAATTSDTAAPAAAPADSAADPSPTAQPDPAPQAGGASAEQTPLAPAAATSGTLGLFTMEIGQTLQKGGWSASFFANKFGRMPGSLTILQYGLDVGYGITDRLNVYAQFLPDEHVDAGDLSELSFNTPITNPGFGTTIYRSLCPITVCRPGYVQDYPLASRTGGGVGPVTVGLKFGILSEDKGQPISLSIRNDFVIPTYTNFQSVQQHEVQNGQFNDRIMIAASKDWRRYFLLTANAGVFLTPTVKGAGNPTSGVVTSSTVAMEQAQQFLLSGGFIVFPDRRVQIMNEYNGVLFFGDRTPDNSFGAEDPMDGIWGVRLYPLREIYVDAGYRYMLNLSNEISADRSGFVIKVGTGVVPAKPVPPNYPPVAACSVNTNSITAGTNAAVTVSTTASDPQGYPLTYSWTATGGQVEGTGPQVRWVPDGAAPGNYVVTVTVMNDHGGSAMCSVTPTLVAAAAPPPANLPPTVTLTADRNMVFVGEHVHWTANGMSPENFPLRYTWAANAGQLTPANNMADLDTTGVNPGMVTVTVRVEDGHGGAADASGAITVQAAPPPPQASKINSCDFSPAASSRVDNVCKRVLDDVALRLQNEPRANAVIIGFAPATARNSSQLATDRAQQVADYLTSKGVDRGRFSVRPGTVQPGEDANRIDIIYVPEGATY